jgi:hypothetical protein
MCRVWQCRAVAFPVCALAYGGIDRRAAGRVPTNGGATGNANANATSRFGWIHGGPDCH